MANSWPKSTRAVRKQEASNWEIGDALIEECGSPGEGRANNDSLTRIKDFTTFLFSDYGIERSVNTLREVRDICHVFPHAARAACVSWSVYRIFRGNPDLLLEWINKYPSEGMTAKAAREMIIDYDNSLTPEPEEEEEPVEDEPQEDEELAEDEDEEPIEIEELPEAVEAEPAVSETVEEPVVDEEPEPSPSMPEIVVPVKQPALAQTLIEAENMFAIAVKLVNLMKSNPPKDLGVIAEFEDIAKQTRDELNKLLRVIKPLLPKSESEAPAAQQLTPTPTVSGSLAHH